MKHITSMPAVVRIGGALIVAACALGVVQAAQVIRTQVSPVGLSEFDRREQWWSYSYGFARACGYNLLPDAHVVLVNPRLGPGEPAPDALEFDPDASHFAYSLAPRVVSVQWDLSSPSVPQRGESDYVALWDQSFDRTAAQRAAAASERALIERQYGGNVVCTYADAAGNQGTIYAISARAIDSPVRATSDAPTEPLTVPYGSWANTVRAMLGVLSLWAIGVFVVSLIIRRGMPVSVAIAVALPVGCLAVALELTTLSLVRLQWSVWTVALPCVALGLAAAFSRHTDLRRTLRRLPRSLARLTLAEAIPLLLLVAFVGVLVGLAPLGLPAMDGFSGGYFKARFFLANGGVLPFYANAVSLMYGQPTHPPLVALTLDWLYYVTDAVDEHATLVLWPALLGSLLAGMLALLRCVTSLRSAAWFTLVLALSAFDLVESASHFGYADLPLAVFVLGGVGLVWLWAARADTHWLVPALASVCLTGAAWTKEEGLFAGPVALLLVLVIARTRPGWLRTSLVALTTYAVLLLPILVLRVAYPAPEVLVHASGLSNLTSRLPPTAFGFVLRGVQHWYLPIALLGLAGWQVRSRGMRSLPNPWYWLPLVVAGFAFLGDVAAVAVTPFEVDKELKWAAGRLLMQTTPLVYLAAFTMWSTVSSPRRIGDRRPTDITSAGDLAAPRQPVTV